MLFTFLSVSPTTKQILDSAQNKRRSKWKKKKKLPTLQPTQPTVMQCLWQHIQEKIKINDMWKNYLDPVSPLYWLFSALTTCQQCEGPGSERVPLFTVADYVMWFQAKKAWIHILVRFHSGVQYLSTDVGNSFLGKKCWTYMWKPQDFIFHVLLHWKWFKNDVCSQTQWWNIEQALWGLEGK